MSLGGKMAVKRTWDIISNERRRQLIGDIIYFFETERDEEIGMIAAGSILDFFLQNVGLELYNKGVMDSIEYYRDRFQEVELDMESILIKK